MVRIALIQTFCRAGLVLLSIGVTQPRVSDLVRGKIELFAIDTLVNMATAAGLHVEMRILEAA